MESPKPFGSNPHSPYLCGPGRVASIAEFPQLVEGGGWGGGGSSVIKTAKRQDANLFCFSSHYRQRVLELLVVMTDTKTCKKNFAMDEVTIFKVTILSEMFADNKQHL